MTTNYTNILNDNLDMFDMETAEQIAEAMKEDVTMKEYTVETLAQILSANKWEETTITCPDGAEVVVSPCFYGECNGIEDCDYFLVYADIPWMGGSDFAKVVEQINNHGKYVEELEKERNDLRAYFEEGEKEGWKEHDWSFYSDWHKDLYGYRPHGHVCGEYVRPW